MTDDDSKNNELDDSLKKRINELSDNLKKLIEEIKNKRVEFQISFEKENASPRIINRILSYLSEIDT
ncbi:hypothetical protein, partial [Acinetobacter seifertii]|uniref:hypothetical protein n=1 Tax=Acinetobacter seifertii TaxID=1530123 RepID=UPI000CA9A7B2